jgi:hypothetical protein
MTPFSTLFARFAALFLLIACQFPVSAWAVASAADCLENAGVYLCQKSDIFFVDQVSAPPLGGKRYPSGDAACAATAANNFVGRFSSPKYWSNYPNGDLGPGCEFVIYAGTPSETRIFQGA